MSKSTCACPSEYPKWDDTDQSWSGRCVHEMKIPSFFHMPLAYDMYRAKQDANIGQLRLIEVWPGLAFVRTGMFGGEMIRFLTDCDSPSRMVKLLTPPFDVSVNIHPGGIGNVEKTIRQQQMAIVDRGRIPKEVYLAHLTCPLCAEAKGGEKIMVARRWVASERLRGKLEQQRASK